MSDTDMNYAEIDDWAQTWAEDNCRVTFTPDEVENGVNACVIKFETEEPISRLMKAGVEHIILQRVKLLRAELLAPVDNEVVEHLKTMKGLNRERLKSIFSKVQGILGIHDGSLDIVPRTSFLANIARAFTTPTSPQIVPQYVFDVRDKTVERIKKVETTEGIKFESHEISAMFYRVNHTLNLA